MTDELLSAWPKSVTPPAGAPNIMVFLTDDVGFGACSTFGGAIDTPVLDDLATRGLRFNRFHTTGICSPTRASLLTGRNPHAVNMGLVANRPTNYDGYTSVLPKSASTVARVPRDGGYSTAMFGKGHITPEWEMTAAGPFDRWPTGLGFDYFYGFLGFDTNMWAPALVENTSFVDPPSNDPNYHLERDLADRAVSWITEQKSIAPERPFFVYYATGAAHSPHHAPRNWIDQFRGKFDAGWDHLRAETFLRQKASAVIPQSARLSPRPTPLPSWDSLSPDQRRLAARLMEAYAASLAFADHQVGRIIERLERLEELENTLIIFIQGDNGGSAEGGFDGLLYEQSLFNRYPEDIGYFLERIDQIGSEHAYNHFPAAWAWATNAPFQYYKQVASHFGGTRNGMVLSWPARIEGGGAVRDHFHHVADVMPTLLEAAGLEAPRIVDGVPQDPLDGVSMLTAALDEASAPRRTKQVFECLENFGLYENGWMACTTPKDLPWSSLSTRVAVDAELREWELYAVDDDFSQASDVSAHHPDKLRELRQRFWEEAKAGKILPIHPPTVGREGRPSLGAGRSSFVYHQPLTRLSADAAPNTVGRSFAINAQIAVPMEGVDGVLVSQGGRFGGYVLYMRESYLVFHYNAIGDHQYKVISALPVPCGDVLVGMEFSGDAPEPGSGGEIKLIVNGDVAAIGRAERTLRDFMNNEGFNVGRDTLTPVCDGYSVYGSTFSGMLKKVEIHLK